MATVLLTVNGQIMYRSLKLTVDTEDNVHVVIETDEDVKTLEEIERLRPSGDISDLGLHIKDIDFGMRVLRSCTRVTMFWNSVGVACVMERTPGVFTAYMVREKPFWALSAETRQSHLGYGIPEVCCFWRDDSDYRQASEFLDGYLRAQRTATEHANPQRRVIHV